MTKIVGILNITPDSFSDTGKFFDAGSAVDQFNKMVKEGADVVDIGAQSTRPGAAKLSAEKEWERLEPVLKAIDNNHGIEISIDSFYPEVIKRSLDYNISIINDVSGFSLSEMKKLAASSGKQIIFMHSLTIPADKNILIPESVDIIEYLSNWLESKISELEEAGIKKDKMIFDPGIGFGKSAKQCEEIIMNIEKFKKYGVKILVGHSEKSFLTLFTDKPAGQRGDETKRFSSILAGKGVDYIRVHDVEGNKNAI